MRGLGTLVGRMLGLLMGVVSCSPAVSFDDEIIVFGEGLLTM